MFPRRPCTSILLLYLTLFNYIYITRYEKESTKVGKASFAFAWVLDETGEERNRFVVCMHNYTSYSNALILKNKIGIQAIMNTET